MLKRDEMMHPQSCINRAGDDEAVFVLLARDPVAPTLVRLWADLRVLAGKNRRGDPEIEEAIRIAEVMERQYRDRQAKKERERKGL